MLDMGTSPGALTVKPRITLTPIGTIERETFLSVPATFAGHVALTFASDGRATRPAPTRTTAPEASASKRRRSINPAYPRREVGTAAVIRRSRVQARIELEGDEADRPIDLSPVPSRSVRGRKIQVPRARR